jgi:uncharacterized protein
MKLVLTLVLAMCAAPAALAWEAKPAAPKPTEESVKQLFEAMHTSSLIDTYMTQIEGTVRASMQQAAAGQRPNAQQQKILDDLGAKIVALVKEELNWTKIEPEMVEVYRNTFTQAEMEGMLKFYRSETGRAVVAKLPTAITQSMQGVQDHMKELTPKILQLEKDTSAQLKAAGQPQPEQSAPAAPAAPPAQPESPPKP